MKMQKLYFWLRLMILKVLENRYLRTTPIDDKPISKFY